MSRGVERGERAPWRGPWLAAGTIAGLAALAGGVFLLYPRQVPQSARVAAADCGLVRCSASLPATSTASPAADSTPTPARKGAKATPRASAAAATAAKHAPASPAPRPAAPAPPGSQVTVSFTVDQAGNHGGGQRFLAQFTLVNHGAPAVSGWTLVAGLGQVQVHSVRTSGGEYRDWYATRDGVVIKGTQPGGAIPAHGSAVFYISGWGASPSLGACSFNGASC